MKIEKHGTGVSQDKRRTLDDLTPEEWAAAEDAVDHRKAEGFGTYNDPIMHPTDRSTGRPW